MKKLAIVSLAMGVALAGFAQKSVVKEAERKAKEGADIEAVKAVMQPAFTNPETANSAEPHYIVGKAGFDFYDNLYKKAMIGQGQDGDHPKMAKNLMAGYAEMLVALPLDSMPDEKGKVKPKFSDKIGSLVGAHYGDFNSAAAYFWEDKDYQGAFDAWEVMLNMPANPAFAKHIPQVFADSTLQQIAMNQAIAAYSTGNKELALERFWRAAKMAKPDKQAYDYALSCAVETGKNDTILQICEEALPLFGEADNTYLLQIIQSHINKAEYDKAVARIDQALAAAPDNAALYRTKAYIYEYQGDNEQARDLYKKAMDVNPQFADAIFDYVRVLYNIAGAKEESTTDQAAYQQLRRQMVSEYQAMKDLLLDAKAKVGDNDDLDYKIDQMLDLVKYKLGEE